MKMMIVMMMRFSKWSGCWSVCRWKGVKLCVWEAPLEHLFQALPSETGLHRLAIGVWLGPCIAQADVGPYRRSLQAKFNRAVNATALVSSRQARFSYLAIYSIDSCMCMSVHILNTFHLGSCYYI